MKETNIVDNRIGDNLQGLLDLFDYVRDHTDPEYIIEVGSFIGASTVQFAKAFPDSTIFAVDMWKDDFDPNDPICQFDMATAEKMFDNATKDYYNIVKIKMSGIDFADVIQNSWFEFIYIDANHSYHGCSEDIAAFSCKVAANGILAGHDYIDEDYTKVTKAVNESFSKENIKTFVDTSWCVQL